MCLAATGEPRLRGDELDKVNRRDHAVGYELDEVNRRDHAVGSELDEVN